MRTTAIHNAPIWFSIVFRWVSEYFWLLSLILGEFRYRRTLRRIERATPEPGIDKNEVKMYARRFNLGAQLPWALIGIGKMLGFTPTFWYYFFPQDGNPFVAIFYVVMFAQSCFMAWWIIWADGARKMYQFNAAGAFGKRIFPPRREWVIKLLAAVAPFSLLYWIHFLMLAELWPLRSPEIAKFIF